MGGLTKPQITQVDPTPDALKGPQKDIGSFIMDQFGAGGGAGQFANALQQLSASGLGGVQQFMGQNPEQQVFDQMSQNLLGLTTNGGEGMVQAAVPQFQQNLQFAQGQLANAAPGRFGTSFTNQGIGLGQRALQDFNLFQHQARQGAAQTAIGAGGLLGQLAGQAGQGAFGRNLQASQLGLGLQGSLLQGLLGFAQPQGKDTVVGKSPLGHGTDLIAAIGSFRKGGK